MVALCSCPWPLAGCSEPSLCDRQPSPQVSLALRLAAGWPWAALARGGALRGLCSCLFQLFSRHSRHRRSRTGRDGAALPAARLQPGAAGMRARAWEAEQRRGADRGAALQTASTSRGRGRGRPRCCPCRTSSTAARRAPARGATTWRCGSTPTGTASLTRPATTTRPRTRVGPAPPRRPGRVGLSRANPGLSHAGGGSGGGADPVGLGEQEAEPAVLVEKASREAWGGVSPALCPHGRAWPWFGVPTCWHLGGFRGPL